MLTTGCLLFLGSRDQRNHFVYVVATCAIAEESADSSRWKSIAQLFRVQVEVSRGMFDALHTSNAIQPRILKIILIRPPYTDAYIF